MVSAASLNEASILKQQCIIAVLLTVRGLSEYLAFLAPMAEAKAATILEWMSLFIVMVVVW